MVADVWQISIVDEKDIDPLRDDKLKEQTIHMTEWWGAQPISPQTPHFWHKCFYFLILDMIT